MSHGCFFLRENGFNHRLVRSSCVGEVNHFGHTVIKIIVVAGILRNGLFRVNLTTDIDSSRVSYFLDIVAEALQLKVKIFGFLQSVEEFLFLLNFLCLLLDFGLFFLGFNGKVLLMSFAGLGNFLGAFLVLNSGLESGYTYLFSLLSHIDVVEEELAEELNRVGRLLLVGLREGSRKNHGDVVV